MKYFEHNCLVTLATFTVIFIYDKRSFCHGQDVIPQNAACDQPFDMKVNWKYPYVITELKTEKRRTITAVKLPSIARNGYGNYIRFQYQESLSSKPVNLTFQKKINGEVNVDLCKMKYVYLEKPINVVDFKVIFDVSDFEENNLSKCGDIKTILFGCKDGSNYTSVQGCKRNQIKPLLVKTKKLSIQSSNEKVTYKNNIVEYIMFSQPQAWCVKKTTSGREYAKIDLNSRFLISSLRIGKYRNLSESFKIEYSEDDQTWAWYEGEKEIPTSPYVASEKLIAPPLIARYLKIHMDITIRSQKGSLDISCLKLQLFGCEAIPYKIVIDELTAGRPKTIIISVSVVLVTFLLLLCFAIIMFLLKKKREREGRLRKDVGEDNKLIELKNKDPVNVENRKEPVENRYETFDVGEVSEDKRSSQHFYTSMNENDTIVSYSPNEHYKVPRPVNEYHNADINSTHGEYDGCDDAEYSTPRNINNEYLVPVNNRKAKKVVENNEDDNGIYTTLNDEDHNDLYTDLNV